MKTYSIIMLFNIFSFATVFAADWTADRAKHTITAWEAEPTKLENCNALDEAARFFVELGEVQKGLDLHLKAGENRDGLYADFYIGLAYKRAQLYDLALTWINVADKRIFDAKKRKVLTEHEYNLHAAVKAGHMGEIYAAKGQKVYARMFFEYGEGLCDLYLKEYEKRGGGELNKGVISFYCRYVKYLMAHRGVGQILHLVPRVKKVTEKAGLSYLDLLSIWRKKTKPAAKVNQTPTAYDLPFDYAFSQDGRYLELSKLTPRS